MSTVNAYREILDLGQEAVAIFRGRASQHECGEVPVLPVDLDDREFAEVVERADDARERAEAGETHEVQLESRDVAEGRELRVEVLRERHVWKLWLRELEGGERMPRIHAGDAGDGESSQVGQLVLDFFG